MPLVSQNMGVLRSNTQIVALRYVRPLTVVFLCNMTPMRFLLELAGGGPKGGGGASTITAYLLCMRSLMSMMI